MQSCQLLWKSCLTTQIIGYQCDAGPGLSCAHEFSQLATLIVPLVSAVRTGRGALEADNRTEEG